MISFRVGRPGIRLFSSNQILFLLWMFLLVFPKGGIKIGDIPLTWGYFLLNLVSIFSIFRSNYSCSLLRLQAFLLMVPFQILCASSFLIHGMDEFAFGISFIVSFFFFPWCFFILFSEYIESLDLKFLFKPIKNGVFFIAAYGIFLFIFKLALGKFVEIPFLTVNFHDFGELESKHINRGAVFKLISTYNNGNIYGVCLLMFLPLYLFLERMKWRKIIVILSLILSLSRTVWIGLLFSQIVSSIFGSKKISYLKLAGRVLGVFLGILLISYYFEFDLSFLFDPNLGGRTEQLNVLQTTSIFSERPFHGISEIVYLGILSNFGILGLICYILCMCSPLFFALSFKAVSLTHKRILCGLATYLFVSLSDGALLLIPVLPFYWFLSSLVLRRSLEAVPFNSSIH
jgi:hypothetical protein